MGVVTSFLMPFIIDLLKEKSLSKNASTAMALGVAVILLIIQSIILENIIDKSPWLRRRISPTTFIEGYWYDYTKDSSGNFIHIVIALIQYNDGHYKISGETFDKTKQLAIFNSITDCKFANNDMLLYVDVNYTGKTTIKSLDYLKFNTPANNSIPTSYQGFYIDFNPTGVISQVQVSGCKIDDNDIKEKNNFNTTPDKFKFVMELVTKGII